MEDDKFGFSFDMTGIDRRALLDEAARRLDLLQTDLDDPADKNIPETPQGKLTRAFRDDQAELYEPELYKITDHHFIERHKTAPIGVRDLVKGFEFFWVHFPVFLNPQGAAEYHRLEVIVEFNPDGAPGARPVAFRIWPDMKYQELFKANLRARVQINEHLEFEAKAVANGIVDGVTSAAAAVGAHASGGADMLAGPFEYSITRARIQHTATGLAKVKWTLDEARFVRDNAPGLIVLMQVPRSASEVKIAAALQARRSFNLLAATPSEAIRELSKRLAQLPKNIGELFMGGLPIQHTAFWDVTAKCTLHG